jgi:glycosyltransferase involved in cell wall biosynthesis
MNIAILNTLYSPNRLGGAEISVQLISERLVEIGHVVDVISLDIKANLKPRAEINGVTVHYLPLRNFWPVEISGVWRKIIFFLADSFNIASAFDLWKILRKCKPTIIYANNFLGFSYSAIAVAWILKIPIVHTPRDYYALCTNGSMCRGESACKSRCVKCKIYGYPKKILSANVSSIAAISQFTLEQHKSAGFFPNSNRSKVIYNPQKIESKVPQVSTGLGKRFGYLGRISQKKGVGLLLSIFSELKLDGVSLDIGGDGDDSYVQYLKEKFPDKNIRFLGSVSPDIFFKNIDILIVPSIWNEPFGRTVIEAFSKGIPVIASNRGGLPELVSSETGWIFDPERPESLKESILSACIWNAGEVEILKAAQKFHVERVVDNLESVFQDAIESS